MPTYTPTGTAGAYGAGTGAVACEAAGATPELIGATGFVLGALPGGNTPSTPESVYHLGVQKSTAEGNPGTPSLQVPMQKYYRFLWTVQAGVRQLWADVKQASNSAIKPTIIIRANADVGLNADVTATSAGSTGWITIGPAAFTATAVGVVWVELHNNSLTNYDDAFFDHIIAR